jgi:ketosteroid isomerase-like protein
MVRSFASVLAVCLTAIGCTASDGSTPGPARTADNDRDAVEAAVRSHWAAINDRDTATVGAQHAAPLTIIMTDFPDRFAIPSATADPLWPLLLATRTQYVVEDLEVQLAGDVGIASLYLSGGVILADGRHDARRRRVTEVWVRQADGTWKETHHHDSVFSGL